MYILQRNALVPYSARQMYELVNAVEDYPRFLPWCEKSQIVQQSADEMVASLEIAWKGVHKHFTTRNHLTPYSRIEMILVEGPMKHLEGIWTFASPEAQTCEIVLDLEFELTGHFVDRFLRPMFEHIAHTLVDAFCKRANELYGQP
ncbi:MAG: ubiquinone-binding protein [Gammaproteobacteria bacterium RIFCSPHIGHO2_12_FULL_42_10]|nr:MAG: ubiquinone-binding protein [Gammaproteobacteria bacterium RIFCSPHIGHO2_12_FULL_42_10]